MSVGDAKPQADVSTFVELNNPQTGGVGRGSFSLYFFILITPPL